MALTRNRPAAATAVAAAFCLSAPPAVAVELPRLSHSPQAERADALDAANRRHGRHWDDDWDIDGDDILTGVLILGGLAAIAGIASSNRDRAERYPEPEPLPDEADYQAPIRSDRYRAGGMAAAVDTCVAEVEADHGAVASVDRASRSGEGWYVAGELADGPGFACWIDGAGQVTDVEAGDYGANYEAPSGEAAGEVALAPVQKRSIEADLDVDAGFEVAQASE
jgi:hypothetical protein